jgi:hypothetical protein
MPAAYCGASRRRTSPEIVRTMSKCRVSHGYWPCPPVFPMRRLFQFTLKDLFWIVVLVALTAKLCRLIRDPKIDAAQQQVDYWQHRVNTLTELHKTGKTDGGALNAASAWLRTARRKLDHERSETPRALVVGSLWLIGHYFLHIRSWLCPPRRAW